MFSFISSFFRSHNDGNHENNDNYEKIFSLYHQMVKDTRSDSANSGDSSDSLHSSSDPSVSNQELEEQNCLDAIQEDMDLHFLKTQNIKQPKIDKVQDLSKTELFYDMELVWNNLYEKIQDLYKVQPTIAFFWSLQLTNKILEFNDLLREFKYKYSLCIKYSENVESNNTN